MLGAVAEDGGAVGGNGDGDGGAAKPDDGGGEVEESEDGEELGEVAAEGGEGGDAADPLVHGGDVVCVSPFKICECSAQKRLFYGGIGNIIKIEKEEKGGGECP